MHGDHDHAFRACFPMLAGVEMDYRWGGRLCLSRNDVPAFGEVDEGSIPPAAGTASAPARSTLAGVLAADLATGVHSDLLDQMLNEQPPSRLPPEPIAWIGATARIRWSEMMAGREL